MKKIIVFSALAFGLVLCAYSQKYAFIDTEYILNNIPSYNAAQSQLDDLSKNYESEVNELYTELENQSKQYEAEKLLLTDEMRMKREKELKEKYDAARKLQNDYFGQEGLLFKKREELVKPIQDEVYNAVKELSNESGYAVVFDSAGGLTMFYTNPRYDISDEVLRRLGYKN
jgi:outer membrane protein